MATAIYRESRVSVERGLEGKVALITGASRGIGRAIAVELADRGAAVAVNYRASLSAAEEVRYDILQRGCECELFQGDISDREHARRLITDDTRKTAELAQSYRNLFHPGKAARLKGKCDRGTALATLAATERVAADLAKAFP